MADEIIDNEAEFEEESPLTAEELFELHKAEIDAAFEEKGFFRRMKEMVSGLSKPRSSPEYKLARTELQRLIAPLAAVLLPVLGIGILFVVTAVTGQNKAAIQVEIASIQDEEPELEEQEEPEVSAEEKEKEQIVSVLADEESFLVLSKYIVIMLLLSMYLSKIYVK